MGALPPLVDTHAHLTHQRFQDDLPQVLVRARDAGVQAILCVGYTVESSEMGLRCAEEYPFVKATVGLHPHDAAQAGPAIWRRLERWLQHPGVAAIGETGLDFYRDYSPRDLQIANLRQHLRWAGETGLPLVLHNRNSDEAIMRVLDEEGAWSLTGVFHCFTGTWNLARRAVEAGFLLGVDGPLTYPQSGALRSLVASIPLQHWLIETDCPWLTPQRSRGRRNEPAYLVEVLETLAEIHQVPREQAATLTTANACRLFPALQEALKA